MGVFVVMHRGVFMSAVLVTRLRLFRVFMIGVMVMFGLVMLGPIVPCMVVVLRMFVIGGMLFVVSVPGFMFFVFAVVFVMFRGMVVV
jgi:hypothetical protein